MIQWTTVIFEIKAGNVKGLKLTMIICTFKAEQTKVF
jgi:hypothetical protein